MAKKQDDQQIIDDKVTQLEERTKSLEDQLKRAVADYQNLEKRITEGRSELTSWAAGELIKKLLPVLDNLEKAMGGASEEDRKSGWLKGVELSVLEFRNVLKNEGLEQIGADGQFDPSLHEAVDIKDGEDNMILDVVGKGYKLNGKILRPAQVVVGKSSFAKASEDEKGEK